MAQVTGKLEQIKVRSTAYGDYYDLRVSGQYYGFGKFPPRGVVEGDFVSLEYEAKGNFKNVVKGTLRKDDSGAAAAPAATAPAKQGVQQKGGGWDDRQETISKQAAFNTALTFVNAAISLEAIPLAKSAKPADRLAYLEAMVYEHAAKFYGLATGNEWKDLATMDVSPPADTPAKSAKKPAEAPADDDWKDDDIPF